jgi:hypothetical protein
MSSFQNHFSFLEPLFLTASNLGMSWPLCSYLSNLIYSSFNDPGDPVNGYLFFFVFGLIFISHSSAFKILWTSLLAEWINLMLKWLFNDQRPYWWSQQVKQYLRSRNDTQFFADINSDHDFQQALSVLDLKQFSVTCKTSYSSGLFSYNNCRRNWSRFSFWSRDVFDGRLVLFDHSTYQT